MSAELGTSRDGTGTRELSFFIGIQIMQFLIS